MRPLDESILNELCSYSPYGEPVHALDRAKRRLAARRFQGWIEQNGHRYHSVAEARADACGFVLEWLILDAAVTEFVEFLVERLLRRYFGE